MNILEHIRQELPWLDGNTVYDLTRGKPSPEQLDITQKYYSELSKACVSSKFVFRIFDPNFRADGNPSGLP